MKLTGMNELFYTKRVLEFADQNLKAEVSAGAREFFCAYIDDIVGSLARRVWLSRKPAHRGECSR
jgi:hypothetical protein